MTPTPEQEAIVAAARASAESLMITAMAGTGKTTMLTMVAKALPIRPTLAVVFNKKNAIEMEKRFPSHFKVQTMNGLGHNAWCKTIGKRCGVDDKKIGRILKAVLAKEKVNADSEEFVGAIQLVRRARVNGLVPKQYEDHATVLIPDNEDGWQSIGDSLYVDVSEMQMFIARTVLAESVREAYQGIIDYDDQIYMSALFGGVFPKFPICMVDEAQDLSPLNHIQVAKSAADRLIVVGDPRQAIYAFRGADSSSMDTMRGLREQWKDLPLSVTFRCPKSVVARQQHHVPGFSAAPANGEGEVHDWSNRLEWKWEEVPSGPVAILCRNNAPLFSCALRLIRKGVGVTVMGSEIGKALIALAKKLFGDDDLPVEGCLIKLHEWADAETSKARANNKEERVAVINEKVECLEAIIEEGDVKFARDVTRIINKIFDSSSMRVTLATGHKSKGLEWDTVLHLDPQRIPSKYARASAAAGHMAPLEQDMNLKYVIETRTQKTLILAKLESFV